MDITYILAEDEYYTSLFIKSVMQSLRPAYSMVGEAACSWTLADMMRRYSPDLILVDMQLADDLSVGVLMRECQNVPIIAFADDPRYEQMLMGLNVVSLIYKPVSQESLAKALHQFEEQAVCKEINNQAI